MNRRLLPTLIISLMLLGCQNDKATQQLDLNSGQWLFINYWASWCKPCIEEIPEFNHLAETLKGKAQVYAVNFDGIKGDELTLQANKIGIAFTLLEKDPSQTLGHPIPQVLPSTYIYNPEGQLHKTLIGPQTLESLLSAIE